MPKFIVECFDIIPVKVEVEADNLEAALDAAEEGHGSVVDASISVRIRESKTDSTSVKELAKNIREWLFEHR